MIWNWQKHPSHFSLLDLPPNAHMEEGCTSITPLQKVFVNNNIIKVGTSWFIMTTLEYFKEVENATPYFLTVCSLSMY